MPRKPTLEHISTIIKLYMSELGSKGGAKKGSTKKRGSKEYYQMLGKLSAQSKKKGSNLND